MESFNFKRKHNALTKKYAILCTTDILMYFIQLQMLYRAFKTHIKTKCKKKKNHVKIAK